MVVIVMCIILVCVLAVCTSHYNMYCQLKVKRNLFQSQIRGAAELSVAASNTVNPVLALIDVLKAQQTIYVLQSIYGKNDLKNLTHMDTERMQEIIEQQRIRVTQDILDVFPGFVPNHPLMNDANFLSPFSTD